MNRTKQSAPDYTKERIKVTTTKHEPPVALLCFYFFSKPAHYSDCSPFSGKKTGNFETPIPKLKSRESFNFLGSTKFKINVLSPKEPANPTLQFFLFQQILAKPEQLLTLQDPALLYTAV